MGAETSETTQRVENASWELVQSARAGLILFVLLTLLTGVVYPLVVTGVALVAFPSAAAGSVIRDGERGFARGLTSPAPKGEDRRAVGSELLGQPFDDPRYFWGRPSASTPAYNGMGGSGSNQATTNPALREAVIERMDRLQKADPENKQPIPIDLVTASASGLDPHVSPSAAQYQAARVARERQISLDKVQALIAANTESPTYGFLGQPRVHILRLNRALDAMK